MFLTKTKTGTYLIVYQKKNGKRSSKSTRTKFKPEAMRYLKNFRQKFEDEMSQEVIPISLKQYLFDHLRRVEPHFTWKTIKTYKTTCRYVNEFFGPIQLNELNSRNVEDYLLRRASDVSIFAAKKDLTNLSAALNKAVLLGYLKQNPCKGIRRYKLPERQPIFYTQDEFQKLISVIDSNDLIDIVVFAVNTGLRQMELIMLTWQQINFDEKYFLLDNQTSITKTKRVRTIPLNPDAFEIIMRRAKNKVENTEQVFTLFGKPIDQHWLSCNFKKYVYKAKVNPKCNFHSLRHTFASWMVQSGISIYVVSKLLGHSNISTTEIYAHLRRDDLQNAVNIISLKKEKPELVEAE